MYFTRQVHLGKAESTGTVLESNVHMLFKLIICVILGRDCHG